MRLVRLLLIIFILLLPLGQFGRLPVGGESVNVYLNDIFLSLIVFLYFIYALAIRKQLTFPPLAGLIVLFLSIAFITLLNGGKFISFQSWLVSFFYLGRLVVYIFLYFVTYDLICSSHGAKREAEGIIRLLIIGGLILAISGFIQLKIFPDFSTLNPDLGWDPHQNRLLSTFFDPNFLAAYFVLTLCLTVSLLLLNVPHFSRLGLVISLIIIFTAFILTFSRSGYLMFAITVGILGVLKSKKLLFFSFMIFLVAAFFIPRVQTRIAGGVDPDDSARSRFSSWKNTLLIISDKPVTGVGFNAYRYAQEKHGFFNYQNQGGGRSGAGSDSSLLFVWATTGIFGLTVFILLILKIGFISFGSYLSRDAPAMLRALSLTVSASGAGLLMESNFINSLFYPWIMVWFWLVMGVMIALKESYAGKD